MLTCCRSYAALHDDLKAYQALEFLGDAALGLAVTAHLFYCLEAGGNASRVAPEQLSLLRAAIVKNDTLAFMAVRAGLHKELRIASTSLQAEINAFDGVRTGLGPLNKTYVCVASSSSRPKQCEQSLSEYICTDAALQMSE